MFFVISSIKLGQFRGNLVRSSPNKFAAKSRKRFPSHLNNVSTLPCETWNAHCMHTCYQCVVRESNSKIYPTSTMASNSPIWIKLITACGNIARGVQNTNHSSGPIDDATDKWLPQWRHDPAWPTPFSVAVSVHPDQWWVFWKPFFAILPTICNQLDSNLSNLAATVKVE